MKKKKENKKKIENKQTNSELEENIVVTIRCIDMSSPISNIDKKPCSVCGEMTWISKSFETKRVDKIICEPCYKKNDKNYEEAIFCTTEECLNEALSWAKDFGYNITREEMIEMMEIKIGKKLKVVNSFQKEKSIKKNRENL